MRDSNSIVGISSEELDELFLGVLELPQESRTEWLHNRCVGNQGLVNEILSLAEAHENSGDFLMSFGTYGARNNWNTSRIYC